MTAEPELERRFRRLLHAYPRRYRKHRGEEHLGTLLDSSHDKQHRPTPQQRNAILRGGLANRFRIRGGPVNRIAVVMVTLACAVLGSCLGSLITWLSTPDLPSRAETAAIATRAFDGVKPGSVEGTQARFAYDTEFLEGGSTDPAWLVALLGGDDYGLGGWQANYEYVQDTKEWNAATAHIGKSLQAAGWKIIEDDTENVNGGRSFDLVAHRDGHTLSLHGFNNSGSLRITRSEPAGQSFGLIAGAGSGAVVGWLVAAQLAWHLTVRHPWRWASTTALTAITFAFGSLPLAATALFGSFLLFETEPSEPRGPIWFPVMFILFRPLCILGLLCATAAILTVTLPGRRSAVRLTVGESPVTWQDARREPRR